MWLKEHLASEVQCGFRISHLPVITSWLPHSPSPTSSWPKLLWPFWFVSNLSDSAFNLSSFFIQPNPHRAITATPGFSPPGEPCSFAEPTSQNPKPNDFSHLSMKKILETAGKRKSHHPRDRRPYSSGPLTLSKPTLLCSHSSVALHMQFSPSRRAFLISTWVMLTYIPADTSGTISYVKPFLTSTHHWDRIKGS